MDDASPRGPARYANGRFGPGNPGRLPGSRNRITQRIALSLLNHYEANEAQYLEKLSSWQGFPQFMRLIERMLPRELEDGAPELAALSSEDAARVTRAVRTALDRAEGGEGSLEEVLAALMGEADERENTVEYGDSTEDPPAAPRPRTPVW